MVVVEMSDEQRYIFDLQGYIVLKGVVPDGLLAAGNEVLDRFPDMDPARLPEPLQLGQEKTDANLYISNIMEGDRALVPFMRIPEVLGVIEAVTGGPYRLNHTYAIYRSGTGYTGLHMGGTPVVFKCQYRVHNGHMLSTLTKAVFPMLPCGPEDGCFAVIPGSHKSNFARPWGQHPGENPALVPVSAEPGDAVIFTEALAHGSTVNTSGRERRTLYYCYSTSYMPDWGSQHGLVFSDNIGSFLTPEEAELVALR